MSIETELNSADDILAESKRLYVALQQNVDDQIKETGFVPPHGYGMNGETKPNGNGNGHHGNGNGHRSNGGHQSREESGITEKQISLIDDIIKQNNACKVTSTTCRWRCLAAE